MKCATVRSNLAGYLDDGLVSAAGQSERVQMRQHLEACASCREELQRYRKLSLLLSRAPRIVPPSDLAVRIKVAAAQRQNTQTWKQRVQALRDRAEIYMDNVFRPVMAPATGGFFSAMLVFVVVLHMMVPGISVQAVPNDVPLNLMQPAELLALSDNPGNWAPEQHETELSLPHGLVVDVTVDQHGQMLDYQILSGPDSQNMRHQLNQMLLFSRFRPMMSFGQKVTGGHVILSFSAVRVRG
ncbi:MAG TPA: zf-HC2 domain-containing protein [Candidatus Acidoferrum sp.]|nr:zf-HC2 domain-containing protein [Candidatus Acidoferrum sp.]